MTELIALEKIRPNPYQPRQSMDPEAVGELAQSIDNNGLNQIPSARRNDCGFIELVFGHRRYEAFKLLNEQYTDGRYSCMPLNMESLTDLQMFERGVAENIDRRDLNDIEKAEAMRRYMTEFLKSSTEAAAFFHVSPETVRGTVRLLNLPEPAKDAVRRGVVNVTNARTLLTLQAIAGEAAVVEAVGDMGTGIYDTPAEAIEAQFQSKAVRFDLSNGWSNPRRFPTRHLPALTRADINAALELDRDTREEIKAEAAELLPLANGGMEITDKQFPFIVNCNASHLNRVRVMVNSPKCEGCPFHASLQNAHYCGWEACMKRKQAAWKVKENEDAARRLEIALYTPDDGSFVQLYPWKEGDRDLFGQRGPDLRLMPSRSLIYNNFEGVPGSLMLVAVGEALAARAAAEQARNLAEQAQDAQADADREARAKEAQVRAVRWEYVARFGWEFVSRAFAAMFESISTYPALQWFYFDYSQYTDDDLLIPDEAAPERVMDFEALDAQWEEANTGPQKAAVIEAARRLIGYRFLHTKLPVGDIDFGKKNAVLDYAAAAREIADEWGVKLPRNFNAKAEQYNADMIEAVKDVK